MCPPVCRNVTIHVDVFGRAHPSGNSNLCPMPLQFLVRMPQRDHIRGCIPGGRRGPPLPLRLTLTG